MSFQYEKILEDFQPKIKKSLYQTAPANREDLEQEIKMKIYEKMDVIQNIDAPGFYEFVSGHEEVAETIGLYLQRHEKKKKEYK
ncbi:MULTISPECIES: hypothetical protein [Shouchella]|uniref:Sigma-O factor regulatory protein rsoA n=3 Tax=Bacillaceae TaxID=186817 RepID=A0A060M5M7_9BACI|nr:MULTISPECIES: hypothetical protein [Bacillaceae]RQW18514.1 hypothetical protein EH196_16170 [Bacillus sp. C1-1]AIC95858.1 Sigma-O factor regulatory protein rsoA [Shouchella lehensis G1]KQL56630.1 hypothetical protein AN965_13020 [Alkalicoccobacillus plakortidis]MBG9784825.1 hypothetical protein [Shouchella lehensis]TES46235.1 hypothetical protein E2L03_16130 [Shouchella lehensis]